MAHSGGDNSSQISMMENGHYDWLYLKVTIQSARLNPTAKFKTKAPLPTLMAGQTIDDLLKGHTIRPNKIAPEIRGRGGWLLDGYTEPFSRKLYAAIVAEI